MKKKIFGGIAILAIAAVAAWNVSLNSQKSNNLLVGLNEVEALADPEYVAVLPIGGLLENWKEYITTCVITTTIGIGSPVVITNSYATTVNKNVCGYGSGSCLWPAGC